MAATQAVRLSEIGTNPAVSCDPATPIGQVARQMAAQGIGAVVVTKDGHVVGIVTDRDLIVRAMAAGRTNTDRVSSVMSRDVACVLDTASTVDAARQMAVRVCRRLPVIDDEGRVVGIVSADDLIRHDADSLEQLGLLRSHERPQPAHAH